MTKASYQIHENTFTIKCKKIVKWRMFKTIEWKAIQKHRKLISLATKIINND